MELLLSPQNVLLGILQLRFKLSLERFLNIFELLLDERINLLLINCGLDPHGLIILLQNSILIKQ